MCFQKKAAMSIGQLHDFMDCRKQEALNPKDMLLLRGFVVAKPCSPAQGGGAQMHNYVRVDWGADGVRAQVVLP